MKHDHFLEKKKIGTFDPYPGAAGVCVCVHLAIMVYSEKLLNIIALMKCVMTAYLLSWCSVLNFL